MITTIEITNHQKNIPISPAPTIRKIKEILALLEVSQARLSIVFVTDRKMHVLNKKYLNHDYPTDVLAFDFFEGKKKAAQKKKGAVLEGEIIISATTARRSAKEYGIPPEQELFLYIIHGILHLMGFDDHSADGVKKMRRKEKEICSQIIF